MRKYSHGCTLDCFDTCKFNVYAENGVIVKLEGDKEHPFTKGLICSKGRKHLERLNHPERVTTPMMKIDGQWQEISFSEAIAVISDTLSLIKKKYGSQAVLHYFESGSGGILKAIPEVFFNFYGGVTVSEGSTCWGAGIAAQKIDFGDVRGHFYEDLLNSNCVVLWGRNPADTNIHLYATLKKAKDNGGAIILIDPIQSETSKIADQHIAVQPGTDGALALAMAKIIVDSDLHDKEFIQKHVLGFDKFQKYLSTLDLEQLSQETGIELGVIEKLALNYSKGPACIYIGYGMQKYSNGGNTVRAIDALAAITGNVGRQGGGVNYANRIYPAKLNLDPYESRQFAVNERRFQVSEFAKYIEAEGSPPIEAIFITRANPLNQLPDLNRVTEAFKKIPLKVCIDMFMTDTAKVCDLFIPSTHTFESEDIVYTSMGNPYIIYNEKIVEPKEAFMDEYLFFQSIAEQMNLTNYPMVTKEDYLLKVVEPLADRGIDLRAIKENYVTLQDNSIAWHDLKFKTESGLIELYSDKAMELGLPPIPQYKPIENKIGLRLLTVHPKSSLFSQHFIDVRGRAWAVIHPNTAEIYHLQEGTNIKLASENGRIEVELRISKKVPEGVVLMNTGWWGKHGNPNFMISTGKSDVGGQVTYHETFVNIIR